MVSGPSNDLLFAGLVFEIISGTHSSQFGILAGLTQDDDEKEAGNDRVEIALVNADGMELGLMDPTVADDSTVGCHRRDLRVAEGFDALELDYDDSADANATN